MSFLVNATKKLTDKVPPVISPGAHAVMDYALAAVFFSGAMLFWRRNKRAGLASLFCGGAELLVAASTDYPGGLAPAMSLRMHGRVDVGLTMIAAEMPRFFDFSGEPEARFFEWNAVAMAAVAGLTDFKESGKGNQLDGLRKTA